MPIQTQRLSIYRRITATIGEIFEQWSQDNAPRLAASLAYYTILSSAPLLVISVALAARVFGQQAVQGQLAWEIQTIVGGDAAQAIQAVLRDAHGPSTGLTATLLSIRDARRRSVFCRGGAQFRPEPDLGRRRTPNAGSWIGNVIAFIKKRFYSSLVVVAAGCLLLLSLVASAAIATVGKFFRPLLPTPEWVLHLAAFAASFFVLTLLFWRHLQTDSRCPPALE